MLATSRHRLDNNLVADQVYLSLWLNSFNEESMLDHWRKVLEAFPASLSQPGVRGIAVIPFSWAETAVLEQVFAEGISIPSAVETASEFLHSDYAYLAAMRWDMWRQKSLEELAETDVESLAEDPFDDEGEDDDAEQDASQPDTVDETLGWKRVPMEVTLTCIGRQFDCPEQGPDAAASSEPHLRIDLGLDTLFLPGEAVDRDEQDWDEATPCYRDNIAKLLGFIRRVEAAVPVKARLLWSAGGDDLAARIREAYADS